MVGDGNGDGIKDSVQAKVTSLQFRETDHVGSDPQASMTPVTLVADSKDGQIAADAGSARITSIRQIDAPADAPEGFSAPLGLLSFTAELDTAGATESFSFFVDGKFDIDGYYKQDANGNWVNLASAAYGGSVVQESGRIRLDFVIEDGGHFDLDGKVDGVITDPGAPGKLVLQPPAACPFDPFRNDADNDQLPDSVEQALGTNADVKDNDVFGDSDMWVNQLWRDLYGREGQGDAQAAELANGIRQGSLSKTQVLNQVLGSDELDSHASAVIRLYHAVLDRNPELCGYNYWLGRMNEGMSALEIGQAFLHSTEFLQLHSGMDDGAFVNFIYQTVLRRAPDAGGAAWWLTQLGLGTIDRAGMLYGVANSAEARTAMADEVAVDLLYLGLLNRDPDVAGSGYWLEQFGEIGDLTQFMVEATSSTTEYHDRFMPSDGSTLGVVGVMDMNMALPIV